MNITEEVQEIIAPTTKIYKSNSIRIAAFLGGPLTAGYLIAENYKALGDKQKVRATWIISVVATAIIVTGCMFLPDNNNRALNYLIPLILSWIAYYVVQMLQGKQITDHLNAGGVPYSVWRAVGISLIGIIVTCGLLFVVFLAFPF